MRRLCLNIEIVEEERTLACGLYENAAFTDVALDKTCEIIRESNDWEFNALTDPVEKAVRLLEMTGAGVDWLERTRIGSVGYEIADCIDSEEGLLFISESGIEYCHSVQEARVCVDIVNREVWFDLFDEYTPKEYKDAFQKIAICTPVVPADEEGFFYGVIGFDDVKRVRDIVAENTDGIMRRDGMILQWIV